jgi:iron-sulfur cluster assembly protein
MSTDIKITDKARHQLKTLDIGVENFLRLWVESGGCSGLSYKAAIDDRVDDKDQVLFEDLSLKVITDAQSAQYMAGLEIDYSDDLVKAGFRFSNPNATATCGCGASFKARGSGGCG